MKLIVAEKPSVAASLARIVGATKKNDGYFEGHNFIVTYCIGHLLQLAMPDIYGHKTWQFNDLPIIPDKFKYVTAPETVKQCNIVCDLMADMRVDGIICATDSAREGELIFRRIFSYAIQKSSLVRNKPVYRLWVSSTEDAAYRHGLKTMRPDSEYNNLYQAGNSRAIADWIIGINGTRAYTTAFNVKLPVGRVKTPILAFIVQREQEIENFKPELYYRLTADHGNFKTFFKTSNKDVMGDILSSYRLSEAVVNAYSHTENKKAAPLLYNTTQIMKDANALFGYAELKEELNSELYNRMFEEQEHYRNWLLSLPPEEILFHAFSYSVREDILMTQEENNFSIEKCKALLESPTPLADMKHAYDKTETNYMDDIRSIMENHANDVIKENKKKNSDRETALPSVRGVADFAKLFANDRISGAEKEKD